MPPLSVHQRVFRVYRRAGGRFETRNAEMSQNALGVDMTLGTAIATASREAASARRKRFNAIVQTQQSDGS